MAIGLATNNKAAKSLSTSSKAPINKLTEFNLAAFEAQLEASTDNGAVAMEEMKRVREVQKTAMDIEMKPPTTMLKKAPVELNDWVDEQGQELRTSGTQ
ncbi:hypothetical protein CC86DRAFT_411059 [Ophiobolus disseminans]|uniref:Uncharacterized protein n=1 Tax=Ophiobolus disseminans TaxID=1469910 RepID=A0A6A6ZMA4_9PLEO|nr:hypothetical protein CC86DRAFT_411059 [Ophiobolus disseminans]